ncbi:methyltransferase [Exilibacterium tricleocarpae]|uniref:Methyltransferase n=2 Tax=Exilibacterium tricleocarpae TaxID=2591008 RepID=A0A545SSC2_9GAMM|nr:methyltransferase [Exilibacterium tricleocarpae]
MPAESAVPWHLLEAALAPLAEDAPAPGADSRRLLHGRGGKVPGWEFLSLDYFAPVLLATLYQQPAGDLEADLCRRLAELAPLRSLQAVVIQRRYRPGAPADIVYGRLPETLLARRGALRFSIRLAERQNIGFFLDMEPGRRWLEQRVAGKRLLNLFAYTCAFSVVAQAAGAAAVVNVDMSRTALTRGRDNHRLNGLSLAGVGFMAANIMKSWGRIHRRGPFDIAVIDPPSYQPGSFVAAKDYPRVIRRVPQWLRPGGELLLCLNAPEISSACLRDLVAEACPACRFAGRLPAHPDFPDRDPERQLKLLHYRYEP